MSAADSVESLARDLLAALDSDAGPSARALRRRAAALGIGPSAARSSGPRDRAGRFDLARLSRRCADCPHTLGEHAAGSGRPGAPRACVADACDCAGFRAARR